MNNFKEKPEIRKIQEKKLLVVVDMQNDFISGSLGTKEAQAIVPNVVEKIKNWDGDILLTQDTHMDDVYLKSNEGKHLPVEHCIRDTDGWFINSKVMHAASTNPTKKTVIQKFTFGGLNVCKEAGKDNYSYIELVGLCTDICVVTNALLLKTYFPEREIAVDSTCCAGVTPEKHEAALEVMRSCQITVY